VARLLLRCLAMPEILPLIVLVVALHLLVVATTE
jgi:F0F1-type ATP synthase membrane subunit c/vacuolar-type H+-ATPase subunit K